MDLINRQDAIDALCKEWCGCKNAECKHPFNEETDDYRWCSGCDAVDRLKELPSAQKNGRWIPLIKDEPLDPRVKCSECGNIELLHSGNYCPNCMAKMEESK